MQHWIPAPEEAHPDLLAFTPVPRKYRYDGWTAERQRAFIAELALTGSVKAAARRINMSSEGAYYLRRQPGAEEFRAAWHAALTSGVQRLTDIAIDRAMEGVSTPVFFKGEQVGERTSYNDRLLMFVMKHHIPAIYDDRPIGMGTKHPDTIAREAAENCPVCKARAEEEPDDDDATDNAWLDEIFKRYDRKLAAERRHRLAGETAAADYVLRQLTHIELILDAGGRGMALLDRYTNREVSWGTEEIAASPISRELDRRRRMIWAAAGEPRRPPLPLAETLPSHALAGGATIREREKAQRAAEARMAAAQAMWEAAATEESWRCFREAGASLATVAEATPADDGRFREAGDSLVTVAEATPDGDRPANPGVSIDDGRFREAGASLAPVAEATPADDRPARPGVSIDDAALPRRNATNEGADQ